MNTPLFARTAQPNVARRSLRKLAKGLRKEYLHNCRQLSGFSDDPPSVQALTGSLTVLARLERTARSLSGTEQPAHAAEVLEAEAWRLSEEIRAVPATRMVERRILSQALALVSGCQTELSALLPAAPETELVATVIRIPADLLFQAYLALFPAERMMVVAGRRETGGIRLGAVFEVTGDSSAGHVRADPGPLGQALIAMTVTDTHLAAWLHSHPGSGSLGTFPSSTDLRQHQDWLTDYSPLLLSGIFVENRYVRFWGTALDEKQIALQFVGSGIDEVDGNENVYRLEI